jgi:hypothetical protein
MVLYVCLQVCKCVIKPSGNGNGEMNMDLGMLKMVQINKPEKGGKDDAMFSFNMNVNKGDKKSKEANVNIAKGL